MREHTKIWVAVYAAGVMAGILYANLIAQESSCRWEYLQKII